LSNVGFFGYPPRIKTRYLPMIRRLRNVPAFSEMLVIGFALSAAGARNIRSFEDYLGPQFSAAELKIYSTKAPSTGSTATDALAHWNQIAIDASGLDHTPVATGDPRIFGEQVGPARASRAMAIVHIAIFDANQRYFGGISELHRNRVGPAPRFNQGSRRTGGA
jgi:hypothetical protein